MLHSTTHLRTVKLLFKIILLGLLTPLLAYAQPVNDDCATAIELGLLPYCSQPAQYTNVGATATVIDPDPNINTPSCFTQDPTRDVWFTFVVPADGSILDVHISVLGNTMGNGTMQMPQVALYRGDCVDGVQELDCASAAVNVNEVFLDVFGLTPGVTYYLRINDYSATAASNAGTFKLCAEKFIPAINMGVEPGSSFCQGTLYDSGGPLQPYDFGENLTFDICPTDPHQCIYVTIENYTTNADFDLIRVFQGTALNPLGLVQKVSGMGQNIELQIPTDCASISFVSDFFFPLDGFEITWACSPDVCPDPTPVIPIPDNCTSAINIPNPTNYCSNIGEFDNSDATPSVDALPSCWFFPNNDVWFSFTATDEKVIINVNGNGNGTTIGGTMLGPQAALYGGTCNGLVELNCFPNNNFSSSAKLSFSGLVTGQTYFIRVTGINAGTFQLCITNDGVSIPGDDCANAIPIPDPSNFCSAIDGSDNTLAYNSDVPLPSCWFNTTGDIWYSFTAVAAKALISINSPTFTGAQTPQVAVYSGACGNLTELGCDVFFGNGSASVVLNNLVPGQTYFIRADADAFGTFQYCVLNTDQAVPGDECVDAIVITDPTNFCSQIAAIDNTFATPSNVPLPSCWPTANQDVWLQFTAVAGSAVVTVNGASFNLPGGTMQAPRIAVYSGTCPNLLTELACSVSFNPIGELLVQNLTPGQTYYVRIDGESPGSFQYCIRNFFSEGVTSGDCPTAIVLCDKSSFNVVAVVGAGNDPTEMDNAPCFAPFINGIETTSTWYVWTAETSGPLTFTLTPNNPADDLDFVVYRLPNGVGNCSNKIIERCMASGDFFIPSPCMGPTGLVVGDPDVEEDPGCTDPGDDAFLQELNMIAGRTYALVINNFTSTSNGFQIDFGGSSTFQGPVANIGITPGDSTVCVNQTVTLIDSSTVVNGTIAGWNWLISDGTTVDTATTQGPLTYAFATAGPKIVTLTIKSSTGCSVTTTRTINVVPCCTLVADVVVNPGCPGDAGATAEATVENATPPITYTWSNGGSNGPIRNGLQTGDYNLIAKDAAGCADTINFTVTTALYGGAFTASADTSILPGLPLTLTGTLTPPDGTIVFINGTDTLAGPSIQIISPTESTFYLAQGTTADGCVFTDSIIITIIEPRIDFPNAFTPNSDQLNDTFLPVAIGTEIINVQVYNRWGKKVWEGKSGGWDGNIDGSPAPSDVYVFTCRYLNKEGGEVFHKGDVTLLR